MVFGVVLLTTWGAPKQSNAQIITRAIIIDGDTFPYIYLREFALYTTMDKDARLKQALLINDVRTTLPYAKMAAFRILMMEQAMEQISDEDERDAYIKKTEKELKEEFSKQLKNLTVNQGKLLVKLINRETGSTVNQIMKKYGSAGERFFYNSFSSLWDYDLDATFDPVEDYRVEYIIQQFHLE